MIIARIFLLFTLIFGFLLNPYVVESAESTSDSIEMQLPGTVEVEKKGDITLNMIAGVFGDPFRTISGAEKSEDAGASMDDFGGLIVGILGILNILAMIYVGSAVVYLWVIFAATTAHQGEKLGGGAYDSLWVPIRQATAFTLVVPVMNGLSVMQILIMACISVSINFANVIWDGAGKYMVDHANIELIKTVPSTGEIDILKALPVMFRNSVLQQIDISVIKNSKKDVDVFRTLKTTEEIIQDAAANLPDLSEEELAEHIKEGAASREDKDIVFYPVGFDRSVADQQIGLQDIGFQKAISEPTQNSNGCLMYFKDTKNGITKIAIRPTINMVEQDAGEIFISGPTGEKNSSISYALASGISNIKTNYIIAIYREVYKAAGAYLSSRASGPTGGSGCAVPPSGGVCYEASVATKKIEKVIDEIVKKAIEGMSRDIEELVTKETKKAEKEARKSILAEAIDSTNGKSEYGWVSAGLFSYALSMKQKELNDGIASFIWVVPGSTYNVREAGMIIEQAPKGIRRFLDKNQTNGLIKAATWFASIANRNDTFSTYYMSRELATSDEEVKSLAEVMQSFKNYIIEKMVGGKTASDKYAASQVANGGVLALSLSEMGAHDPIVAMQTFGSRLLDAMSGMMGLGGVVGIALSAFTGNLGFVVLLVMIILMIGCFFSYIVPIIPAVFWMIAVVSWLFMVIEAMVAAPFWVCAHALPEGKGFAGDHARKGYMLLLEVMTRPALLVVGAIFAIAVCQITGWLFNQMFGFWFSSVGGEFISIGFWADLIYSVIILSIIYYVYYTVFTKGINYMPEKVLGWCGAGSGMGLSDQEGTLNKMLKVGGALTVMSAAKGATTAINPVADMGAKGIVVGSKKTLGQFRKKFKKEKGSASAADDSRKSLLEKSSIPQISEGKSSSKSNKKLNGMSGTVSYQLKNGQTRVIDQSQIPLSENIQSEDSSENIAFGTENPQKSSDKNILNKRNLDKNGGKTGKNIQGSPHESSASTNIPDSEFEEYANYYNRDDFEGVEILNDNYDGYDDFQENFENRIQTVEPNGDYAGKSENNSVNPGKNNNKTSSMDYAVRNNNDVNYHNTDEIGKISSRGGEGADFSDTDGYGGTNKK